MNYGDQDNVFSEQEQELFNLLLEEEGLYVAKTEYTIPRREQRETAVLSFAQQRLWFLQQLDPDSLAYLVPSVLHITGPLDASALKRSLDAVVRRHETLRTTFATHQGKAVQRIAPDVPIALPLIDLSHLSTEQRQAEAQQVMDRATHEPFDLERGPLFRATLIRLGYEDYILILLAHHIITDAWSMGIFYRELGTLYTAYHEAGTSPVPESLLPDLPLQYADFAEWEQSEPQIAEMEHQLDYWKHYLADSPSLLPLPADYPRPPIQTMRGETFRKPLPRAATALLNQLSQQEGTSLFMAVFTVFTTLLFRYTGQTDLLIGTPTAGRHHREIEGLIGFFVNTLVLRVDMSGNPTFRALLARVRDVALDAYANQNVPFERLVETLQPERDLSYHPLFQVMFDIEQNPAESLTLPGLTVRTMPVENHTSKFDLSLNLEETDGHFIGAWEYSADLFTEATINRMADHFNVLLRDVIANPDRPIASLSLLTSDEQQQMLTSWNQTAAEHPVHRCIHHLVEDHARRTPDALAVVHRGESLTYRQLDRRANEVAHHLQARGVGPDVLVGISLERSLDMAVGILAILKAGGAYVPIDPGYPPERIARILDDARPLAVLTHSTLVARALFGPAPSSALVCLDSDEWRGERESPPESGVGPDHLSYVIYTSGSTGTPNGVLLPHCALVNFSATIARMCYIQPEDRFLQFASISFDVATEEIFASWIKGATLVLRTDEVLTSFADFNQFLQDNHITTIHLPTSFWHSWVDYLEQTLESVPPAVRLVMVGAEKVSAERYAAWYRLVGNRIRWLNTYGPTETTVTVTAYEPCGMANAPVIEGSVPIGRPIDNIQVYVLDPHLNPVPVGVVGELYVGGVGLARGYLNRPELTAQKFIPDPFSTTPGARLYRTGDLVRYLPDGNIAFLGRADYQVKVRGFRIELEEVATHLEQHPDVRKAVVIAQEAFPAGTRLIAYIVPNNPSCSLSTEELRRALQQTLPDYMVPAAFVLMESFPLTPSNKIDRRALPNPETIVRQQSAPFVAPRNAIEETLSAIWAEVLGLEQVSTDQNFFLLGGHSLQIMQLIARIAAKTGHKLCARDIFLYPTVAALSEALENNMVTTRKTATEHRSPASDSYITLEPRPLLSLFATGKLPPVDSATFGYLPLDELPPADFEPCNLSRDTLIYDWYHNLPEYAFLLETHLGRIALILLPRFEEDLYQNTHDLVQVIKEGLALTRHLGGRVASLAGLLPSATDYGQAVAAALAHQPDMPQVSTGHATTTAAVVLSLQRLLQESRRDFAQEHVGFLGLGSIGSASLRLALHSLPHPRQITLCDIYSNRERLEALKHELQTDIGFAGDIHVLTSQGDVPSRFYHTTLIIGATSVPDILDIEQVRPGTCIVDDSAPHCFNPQQAINRLKTRQDILFTEGGVLQSPRPIAATRSFLPLQKQAIPESYHERFSRYNPFEITGCILSGLLSARYPHLTPSLGYVDVESSRQHYELLQQLGFRGAALHCNDDVLPGNIIQNFRQRFGS